MTPRMCFIVLIDQRDEHGFIPSVVYENESGHHPLVGKGDLARPWYWGQTYEAAKDVCANQNRSLGLSEDEVVEIVTSSMRRQRDEEVARRG